MNHRIDVHQHLIPDFYRGALHSVGLTEAGGRDLPDWSPSEALELMDLLGTRAAILSISTPGATAVESAAGAAALARELNDFGASLRHEHPGRFGFFATLPMPDVAASVTEAERALDSLHAEGVALLANNRGVYLGAAPAGSSPTRRTAWWPRSWLTREGSPWRRSRT